MSDDSHGYRQTDSIVDRRRYLATVRAADVGTFDGCAGGHGILDDESDGSDGSGLDGSLSRADRSGADDPGTAQDGPQPGTPGPDSPVKGGRG